MVQLGVEGKYIKEPNLEESDVVSVVNIVLECGDAIREKLRETRPGILSGVEIIKCLLYRPGFSK